VRFAESLETNIFSQVYDEIRKIENLNQVIAYIKEYSDFYYIYIIYHINKAKAHIFSLWMFEFPK
jgi:hypothetical protein